MIQNPEKTKKCMRTLLRDMRKEQQLEYQKFRTELRLMSFFKNAYHTIVYNSDKKRYGVTYQYREPGDLSKVINIIKKHPPLPLKYVRNGCVSFEHVDTESSGKETKVFPIYMEFDTDYSDSGVKLRYLTMWKDTIVSLSIKLIGFHNIGSISYHRKEFHGGFRIENCRLTKNESLSDWKEVKLGRGGDEYINDFYLYNDKGLKMETFIKFLNKMKTTG